MDPLVPLIQLIIIGLYLLRFSIINYIPGSIRGFYRLVFNDMKLKVGIWWKTIIIPIIVGFILFLGWIAFHQIILGIPATYSISENVYVYIITSGILAPISEEIVQCFFLSAVFILFNRNYKNKPILVLINFFSLVIVSAVIAFYHDNPSFISFLLRFFHFTIYGVIYFLYNRNLLPAIVTHSSWNLFLLLLY